MIVFRRLFHPLVCLIGATSVSAGSPTSWNDVGALKMLYWATGGPSWTRSWPVLDTRSDPCLDHWYGLLCNTQGEILAMYDNCDQRCFPYSCLQLCSKLSRNNLRGYIPANFARLTALEELDLSSNFLTDVLPHTLGNLASLQSLRLDHNAFTGSVPATLAQLTQLSALTLEANQFETPLVLALYNMQTQRGVYLSYDPLLAPVRFDPQ